MADGALLPGENALPTQEEWEKEWRKRPPRFSCALGGKGYDFERDKPRIHFDARLGYWRSGRYYRVKRCADCGDEKIISNHGKRCRDCSSARWKMLNSSGYRVAQAKAHRAVKLAIQDGSLPILDGSVPCADCGRPASDYDHRDYSLPLVVEPVCRSCNALRGAAAITVPASPARSEPRASA